MTRKSWGIVVLIFVILGAVAYVVYRHDTDVPAQTGPATYDWDFADKSSGDTARTQVTLLAGAKSYDAGTYDGTCSEQDNDYLQYEVAKVVCWSPGGGKEVGVFDDGVQTTLQAGDLDEGSQETPGFRGNFTILKTL